MTPVGPSSGDDAAGQLRQRLAELAELDRLPLSGHVELYQQLHAELQAALTAIDSD
jgi:hypothetical protein